MAAMIILDWKKIGSVRKMEGFQGLIDELKKELREHQEIISDDMTLIGDDLVAIRAEASTIKQVIAALEWVRDVHEEDSSPSSPSKD